MMEEKQIKIIAISINIKQKNKEKKLQFQRFGDFYQIGEEVAKEVKEKLGFTPTLINPKYVTGLDNELLEDLKKNHKLVITLEDGILDGGFLLPY